MTRGFLSVLERSIFLAVFLFPMVGCAVTLDEAYHSGGPGTGRVINADQGAVEINGSGGLIVKNAVQAGELTITGGADIAEPFGMTGGSPGQPGQVVVIDPANPGKLRLSDRAYDKRVAGVIAGAGDLSPGLVLTGTEPTGEVRVIALSGLVYVWADTSMGPIEPGDLLTTSETTGHAMRASDPAKARGATLGKAMGSLHEGKGLVLMLVSLL